MPEKHGPRLREGVLLHFLVHVLCNPIRTHILKITLIFIFPSLWFWVLSVARPKRKAGSY